MGNSPDVHLNLNVRGMRPSATIAINERSNALLAAGRQIFKLGLGQSPFPVPDVVVESLRQHAHEKNYLPVRGLAAAREAVASYHQRRDDVPRSAEDVLVGPGSKELMFLLQLVYYGDLVIPTPAWVSYAPQAKIIGRQVQLVPTRREDGWRLSGEGLEALCREDPARPRLVVLNYPSNPTGGSYRAGELQELARAAERYRVVLLSDEIYGALHHGAEHVSIARYYPQGTIISSGLSKWCGAGGWRLGTFLFPPDLRWLLDAMAAVASETFTSTSAPIQYAAATAFGDHPEIERYLRHARRILAALGRWVHGALEGAGAVCSPPVGGFYLFPDFTPLADRLRARAVTTSIQLCERLLEDVGVAMLPGCEFGQPMHELSARIAYVDFDGGEALRASQRTADEGPLDESFLRRHTPRVVAAVEAMTAWLAR